MAANTRSAIQHGKQRIIAIRRQRAEKLRKAQALVDHQSRKIAVLDEQLATLDQVGRVLDEGWDAWKPDPKAQAYRATPLPLGALSQGALRVLRLAKRPMTAGQIAEAIFRTYSFPPLPPTMLGVVANAVVTNLRRAEGKGIVRVDRSNRRAHLWSIIPIEELRVQITNITKF